MKMIVLYGTESIPANIDSKISVRVYQFDRFLKLGIGVPDEVLKKRTASWKPGETCELVYTVRIATARSIERFYREFPTYSN